MGIDLEQIMGANLQAEDNGNQAKAKKKKKKQKEKEKKCTT